MKRKNKQIINFSVVGIFALALGGSISFMAFGNQGGNRTNIAFIGNNGQNWNDGGFNTNSHNAVTEYTNNSDAKFKTDTYGAYSKNGSTYVSPTLKAFNQGDDIAVSSGFNFEGTIIGQDPEFDGTYDYSGIYGAPIPGSGYSTEYGDKQVVLADNSVLAKYYTNAVSIDFLSQGGGFLAGLAAAMYSTSNQLTSPATETNNTNYVTTYGGMDINVNYDYMSGFEQGVNYWNYAALGYTTANHGTIEERSISDEGTKLEEKQIVNFLGNGNYDKAGTPIIAPIEIVVPHDNKRNYNATTFYGGSDFPNQYKYSYTQNNDESLVNTDEWYTGGFPINENDKYGNAAKDIARWASSDNFAIIFPIAGASTIYTYHLLASNDIHGEDKITQVIGVDSDAVVGDPDADEYILGSATKNLQMGLQYGIWAADYKQGDVYTATDMEGNPDTVDPTHSITNSTDFMKPLTPTEEGEKPGWNYSADVNSDEDLTNDYAGQQFRGTIDNGGSYFTPGVVTNGNYELTDSLSFLKEEFDKSNTFEDLTLKDIADVALAQNPVIEYHSHTFSDAYAPGEHVTVDQDAVGLVKEEIGIDMSPWMVRYNLGDAIK